MWLRPTIAIVTGFLGWWVVASLLSVGLRIAWPDYALVEKAMTFTLSMQVARLAMGALSSLAAGALAGYLARGKARPPLILGIILTLFFLPIHYQLFDKFPLWYHAIFLLSLLPLTVLGARLAGRRG